MSENHGTLATYESPREFARVAPAWNALASRTGDPFLTHEWLCSWWSAFADGSAIAVTLNADGEMQAGAVVVRESSRSLRGAANAYSEDWDVVARNDVSRRILWRELARYPGAQLTVTGLPRESASVSCARETLRQAGFRTALDRHQLSPYLALPDSWEQLLERVSRNHRSQVRRKRKRFEREGRLTLRTNAGPDLDDDLDRFFRIEASGWKGAAGTAILNDAPALRLYTDFAYGAARRGWLRLHFLELDAVPIAADFSTVLGDREFLLKTCFDEQFGHLSPGIVLRAEVLRTAIENDLKRYEFLGGPDRYKLEWGAELREKLVLRAYRGTALPTFIYRHKLRTAARRLRSAIPRRASE
jgi:CelD/BcsL family acetyltransferase involved in cellulose biosynthesis